MEKEMIGKNDAALTPPEIILNPGPEYADHTRIWQGIPSVEKTKDGRLWAAFYGGGTREGKGNYVVLVKSDDNGKEWSEPYLVIKHRDPDIRSFDPCLWTDPKGRIWLFFSQSAKLYDGRAGVWASLCESPDDLDVEFSSPRRIANGIMVNKPTALSTGEWLLPCALWICDEPEEEHGLESEMHSNVYLSVNDGDSFSLLGSAEIPNRHYDEHMIVELADGRLWMLVRTHYGIGQSFSANKGRTWTPGEKTELGGPSSRFFIRRLKSGNILLVNHYDFINRNNLTAMISEDEGQTWKGKLLIDGRDDVSYPDGVEDDDGNIYVVYDYKRGSEREILMTIFTEEDVMAGKYITDNARRRILVNKGAKK